MSIIQDIRDKYAKVAVVAIALALIGFILTDYMSGRGGQAGGRSNALGSINGTTIKADVFARKVEQAEAQMRQQGYPSASLTTMAVENVWNQEINNILLGDEVKKLGLAIGNKELGDIVFGTYAPEDLKKQLSDENGYNPVTAKQKIDRMKKDKTVPQEQKDNFDSYVDQLAQSRLNEKYLSLLANTTNYPRWFLEKQNADNSLLGKASMVRESYTAIPDSTVKVDDKEIRDYISKYKNDFKQEESRSISFVTFNAAPTPADSAAIRNELLNLKTEFDTTNNAVDFLARNGVTNFFEGYVNSSQMQNAAKDSIPRIPVGRVFGPYLDGNAYVLAKLLDIKTLPDSVKCRHILLGTQDRSGNPLMPDSVAHARADSIALAIRNGANFDSLEAKYTTDEAAHADKGVMTFSSLTIQGGSGGFAKEFAQFILFDGKPGDKKVIKTDFGWHYIEILSFMNPQPAFKAAYLSKEIIASQETDNAALEEANQFAADSRDAKAFDENFEKTQKAKGRLKNVAMNITPIASQVQGLGESRALVRNIYNAKLGEVLKPERVNDMYVVAAVTAVNKPGTKDVAAARAQIEPLLRNRKKAAELKKKIGTVTTLEAAAAALGNKLIEPLDSVRVNATASLGYEPIVSGAIFNPANKGKVVPEVLQGMNGVYVLRVENVSATASMSGDISEQRRTRYEQQKQAIISGQSPSAPMNVLKRTATIKDKRSSRY